MWQIPVLPQGKLAQNWTVWADGVCEDTCSFNVFACLPCCFVSILVLLLKFGRIFNRCESFDTAIALQVWIFTAELQIFASFLVLHGKFCWRTANFVDGKLMLLLAKKRREEFEKPEFALIYIMRVFLFWHLLLEMFLYWKQKTLKNMRCVS